MKRIFILIIFIAVFSGCDKRYEDGPCISFVKAENRICGRWTIDKTVVDGTEKIVEAGDTLSWFVFSIFRNIENALFISMIDSNETVIAESLIRYDDRITKLTFVLCPITGYENTTASVFRQVPSLNEERIWTINRLLRKEFWINTYYENKEHEIRFTLLYDYQSL